MNGVADTGISSILNAPRLKVGQLLGLWQQPATAVRLQLKDGRKGAGSRRQAAVRCARHVCDSLTEEHGGQGF